jgi:NAD(P)-dependent dehydrogenase (short-subunit alcohol dehydrogenase family)
MKVQGQVVVVTGGARGIGKALAERFHREGAKGIAVADLDGAGAEAVAKSVGGIGFKCDVTKEADIVHLIDETEKRLGPIGLFCSNAGIALTDPDRGNAGSPPDKDWERSWGVNVMAHVYAARNLAPRMAKRGGGYFLNTVSAAGLLSQIGSATYSTTKHAAIGFAESLAITHKDDNIRVSVLCPQGVDTDMLRGSGGGSNPASLDGVITPEQCAGFVVEGLEAEKFLILPHPIVMTYMQRKSGTRPLDQRHGEVAADDHGGGAGR